MSFEQVEVILLHLEKNPEMLTKNFKTPHSRIYHNKLWERLKSTLNKDATKPKTSQQWQKVRIFAIFFVILVCFVYWIILFFIDRRGLDCKN